MTKTNNPTATPEAPILTEEQVRQMSDDDYMNAEQLAFFKARLQQLEKDLLKNAGETTEHLRETVLVPDPADRATIEEEHALELRTRDRERSNQLSPLMRVIMAGVKRRENRLAFRV
jgi:DnaK suppressor protein